MFYYGEAEDATYRAMDAARSEYERGYREGYRNGFKAPSQDKARESDISRLVEKIAELEKIIVTLTEKIKAYERGKK